jgi:hypothetical protein
VRPLRCVLGACSGWASTRQCSGSTSSMWQAQRARCVCVCVCVCSVHVCACVLVQPHAPCEISSAH